MSYPGDPALASDVQQRILTTFQQTLDLASKGSRQEALLGCDFILRLDPQFGPARTLQQLVQAGRSGPQLVALFGGGEVAPPATPEAPSFGDLSLDLPEDLDLPSAPVVPSGSSGASGRFRELFAARRFQEILAAADRAGPALLDDHEANAIVEQARARVEAAPYVETFIESARQAISSGDREEADRLIRKVRALDADHPALLAIERGETYSPPPAAPADLELPEVDFSFASLAEENFASAAPPSFGASESAGGSGEHSARIAELLETGQAASDRGEYQAAIDAWSRIFLIDIDHQEAARRIEQARQLKAEREREVEEIFHEGMSRFDSGSLELASESFGRVLELSPGHMAATDYLQKIRERQASGVGSPVPAATGGAGRSFDAPPVATESGRPSLRSGRENVSGEILVPPEPGSGAPRGGGDRSDFAVAVKRSNKPAAGFLWIGGLVLLLLIAGGWLVVRNRAKLFPNAEPLQAAAPAVADPIVAAKNLQAEGKTAQAIAQLRRLPPQQPQYAEAQSLISQWEALVQPAQPVPAGLPPEVQERRRALVAAAERTCENQEFLRCDRALTEAATILPLSATEQALQAKAKQGLAPLGEELKLYGDGDFEFLLNRLWRRREAEPGNRDVRQLIVDAYYNLGLLDLQRGDPAAAADKFREALEIDPSDQPLKRMQAFAHAYTDRNEDLLFEIFVRHAPTR